MENKNNILLKVSDHDTYTFFNSMKMDEFFLGSRGCEIKAKANGIKSKHLRFTFDKYWFIHNISQSKTTRIGKKIIGDKPMRIKDGDIIYIMPEAPRRKSKPLMTLEVIKKINHKNKSKMTALSLITKNEYYIGSSSKADILVQDQVEDLHCKIVYDGTNCFIEDLHSLNGTFVNNRRIKRAKLENYDRIAVGGVGFIFFDFKLLSSKSAQGIEIEARNVDKVVYDQKTKNEIKLVDNISLKIKAGEFVAIVGGSGTGKSTFVDCINGVRPCTSGKVLYDGNDYYDNINSYRGVIGIVPQRDIMHDDLRVDDTLFYTAKLRMRRNLSKDELLKRVDKVISDVQLQGKEHLHVSKLSGGQKKRISIAMELLADPKVIFLDEPTSGLSPDLDYEMMSLLKDLAAKGRTIVVITHAMDNIDLCDRVVFLGRGGRLCYFGKPEDIFSFFKAKSYSKVFTMTSQEEKAKKFQEQFSRLRGVDDDEIQI